MTAVQTIALLQLCVVGESLVGDMSARVEHVEYQRIPFAHRQISGEIVIVDEIPAHIRVVAMRQAAGKLHTHTLARIDSVIGQIHRASQRI